MCAYDLMLYIHVVHQWRTQVRVGGAPSPLVKMRTHLFKLLVKNVLLPIFIYRKSLQNTGF